MKRNYIRKLFRTALGLAAALCLALLPGFSGPARAEQAGGDQPLTRIYRAGENLLTRELNMTLRGEAEFFLDGKLFKHAEGIYAQEGTSSYQQIELRTPRRDGSILESGYAVADFGGTGYYIERYPGHANVNLDHNPPKDHALRDTVGTAALMKAGRGIAAALDGSMGETLSREQVPEGEKISFQWEDEKVPALLDAGLNLFWQEAARHFFYVDYSNVPLEGYADIEDYLTVTAGILYSAADLEVRKIQAEAVLDPEGHLLSLKGEADVQVLCRNGAARVVTVNFTLTGENYGTTAVKEVIPEKNQFYSLVPDYSGVDMEGSPDPLDPYGGTALMPGFPDIPVPLDKVTPRTVGSAEEAAAFAGEIAAMDVLGIPDADRLVWEAAATGDGRFEASGAYEWDRETPVLTVLMTGEGEVLRAENHTTALPEAVSVDTEDAEGTLEWRNEIEMMLWAFAENLNPGSTGWTAERIREMRETNGTGYTSFADTLADGDEVFVIMYGEPDRGTERVRIKYAVQVSPQVRVILTDSTIDPQEAGNG